MGEWSQRFHLLGGWSVEGIVSWENGFEMLICWESFRMFISWEGVGGTVPC